MHLRSLKICPAGQLERFPFNVPAIQQLKSIAFSAPVTILVGENGSGKSTLLEALALATSIPVIGREEANRDQSFNPVQPLGDALKLVWNKRTHRGFFLRAEDFFGFVQRIGSLQTDMQAELDRIEREYDNRSNYAKDLARTPAKSSLNAIAQRYGGDLNANSHGESFLTIFQSRFVPGGLYLLDEPEAALSPLRQLGLISLIKQMIPQDAQFILATHSPILMAIPGAKILDLDQQPPVFREYDELESVKLYQAFLEHPAAFVHRL
jgi:predicted ATPase